MNRIKSLLLLAALSLGTAAAAPLELKVNLRVGDQPFAWSTAYKAGGGQDYTVDVVRFYVSEVALVRPDGAEVAVPGVFLADFPRGGPTQGVTVAKLDVPAGQYAGVRFTVGVPRALNHLDAAKAKAPLGVETGMYWSWNAGYIFFKFEGKVKVGGRDEGVLLHMGGNPFRLTVNLADLMRGSVRIGVPESGGAVAVNLDLGRVLTTQVNGAPLNLADRATRTLHGGPAVGLVYLNLQNAFTLAPAATSER